MFQIRVTTLQIKSNNWLLPAFSSDSNANTVLSTDHKQLYCTVQAEENGIKLQYGTKIK